MRHATLLFVLALVVVSCSADGAPPTTTSAPPTAALPTTTAPPASTTTVPTTRELYDTVAASLAFVTTDFGVGSGVLIEGGWIVTNAHVVWPFEEVRVVFPDGTEFPNTPVVGANIYEDLAVLGPIDVSVPPLELPSAADYAVGDTVFLVGYPGEFEEFPTPAITQGVVSRIREWDDADLTFIQTDALIAGGQSGGALVSASGAVLGVSGLGGFSESNFALVAAAEDLAPRIDALIEGATPGRYSLNPPNLGEPAAEHTVEMASYWHDAVFVISEPAGTDVTVELSDDDHFVSVTDSLGFTLNPDDEPVSSFSFVTEYDEPHYVFVSSKLTGPTTVTVTSTVPIALLQDPDDDLTVEPGDIVQAAIDVSGEFDVYRIELSKGQTITVRVGGLFDPVVWVDQVDNAGEPLAFDADSGGGLFGTDAEATFTAPESGEYLIVVSDDLLEPASGYVLTVS